MPIRIERRQFMAALGGAAMATSRLPAAWAQPAERMRLVGILMGPSEADPVPHTRLALLRKTLEGLGWTEGRNIRFEVRWAAGDATRARALATELVALAPDLIFVSSTLAIATMKEATSKIPLVFVIVNDPVAQGFVSNVARPGGNITGFSFMDYSAIEKSLQLLKQVAPGTNRAGFLFNPDAYPYYDVYVGSLREKQRDLGLDIEVLRIHSEADIKPAIDHLTAAPGAGLLVPPEPFTSVHRKQVVALAAQQKLPAIYGLRDYVADGGLMSYSPDQTDIFRRSATYVDRILRGTSPGELPIQSPTRFELAINLKTARAIDVAIPATVLALADEVTE